MATYLQKTTELHISTAPETTFNTPIAAGAGNYKRALADNATVPLPIPGKRDNTGRAGSEFATAQCNTYWETGMQIAGEADFDLMARLWLRAVSGAVTDTTVTASTAFKHAASMTTATTLKSSSAIAKNSDSEAFFQYAGMVVAQAQLSQERVNAARCQFDLVGSGKHEKLTSFANLASVPAFSCVRPFAYLSYNNGGPIDLGVTCRIRNWSVSLNNAVDPVSDRCTGDSTQNAGTPGTSGGASDAAYNTTLTHGDRVLSASFTILLDTTITEWENMAANVALTNITFGVRGALLNVTDYESLKLIIPTGYFRTVSQVESEGKAAIQMALLPTGTTSVLTVEVVNGTSGTFS